MAANSLLYLLLTTGLTTPPDQSVTTESPFGINTEYTREPSYGPTEDATQWPRQTKWPGYGGKPHTENPHHQYSVRPVTEYENDDLSWSQTERPFEQPGYKTYKPHVWPLATEEPHHEAERDGNWPLATEEPHHEVKRRRHRKRPSATEQPEDENERPEARSQNKHENDDLSWSQTERPFEQPGYKTYKPHVWPLATEEPHHEVERRRHRKRPSATEQPEDEKERPEARSQNKRSYTCPQNEHYKRCGTVCTRTCFETLPCPSNCCVEGCFCNKGLVRGPIGNCIEPEDCPLDSKDEKDKRKCPNREHFSKCHKNCEKTCSDYVKPKKCPRSCKKGCVCDGGLVRNKEGKCVARDQCPKRDFSAANNPCPNDDACRVLCRRFTKVNIGRCTGDNHMTYKLMAQDDDSHGCPNLHACGAYCISHGHYSAICEGNTCKCSDE